MQLAKIELDDEQVVLLLNNRDALDKAIAEVRQLVDEFEPDLSNGVNRKKIASFSAEISAMKVKMVKLAKSTIEADKKKIAAVNASIKSIEKEFSELRDDARKPLTDWENGEKARVERHTTALTEIENCEELDLLIEPVDFEEYQDQADLAYLKRKRFLIGKKEADELARAEAAELEVLRAEKAVRDAEDKVKADELAKVEAAKAKEADDERLRQEGEQKAQEEAAEAIKAQLADADKKSKDDKIAAEKKLLKVKLEKEQAEKRVLEAESRAKDAEEKAKADQESKAQKLRDDEAKRKADETHNRKIQNEVFSSLSALGVNKDDAIKVVVAICDGKIPHVSIEF